MKKVIGILLTLIYLFTASSLTHARTMGFFDISHAAHHAVPHCHQDDAPLTNKKATQSMNCCELFSSDQYSQAQLTLKTSIKVFHTNDINDIQQFFRVPLAPHEAAGFVGFSPGSQTVQGKYLRFSDLFGIIEKTL